MLHTIIKPNLYQDSVSLMLLANKLSSMDGVEQISIMMGTPANKDIFKNTGLYTPELDDAKPSDMCIVIRTEDPEIIDTVLEQIDSFIQDQSSSGSANDYENVRTWDRALQQLPDANMALLSIPGQHAATEAHKALDRGLHVFMFSDNVSKEDEKELKDKAHDKGLLVMGPDCGTGILSGVPLAFANVVEEGNIGIVGASGTGIQEVSSLIDRLGGGITHAIGTGGRDLKGDIGAVTMLDGIAALEQDPNTKVIVVISKPPEKAVREQVVQKLRGLSKPAVAVFMGEKPEAHETNIQYAYTLEETARYAIELAKGQKVDAFDEAKRPNLTLHANQTAIKGLYSGGTLASEAAMLLYEVLGIEKSNNEEGYLLKAANHEVIDLGDDKYTKNKPHPMIDPSTRNTFIEEAARDEATGVILFDTVLGYGSHDDPAGEVVKAVNNAKSIASEQGKELYFVTSICGTSKDPQTFEEQKNKLIAANVIVEESNVRAVKTSLELLGKELPTTTTDLPVEEKAAQPEAEVSEVSQKIMDLLVNKPRVVNVGLASFAPTVINHGGKVVQYDWQPVAGGNERLAKILAKLQ
ncbi:membrane protein FdrA [Paraliobacillus sp. PM-2]|uniref:acyl-CoA synthetase FdrA n=1 Tax=Paraliobacillus sp. PM-2 TaxID=1462524 RepID=UPI00061C044C|nr:acyl-CoA synthetase FdrA [Paraliobacillus sp. PM-2]CQR46304.1 membrane protein FdrA [Paraliobacillus sp. PM-2]